MSAGAAAAVCLLLYGLVSLLAAAAAEQSSNATSSLVDARVANASTADKTEKHGDAPKSRSKTRTYLYT